MSTRIFAHLALLAFFAIVLAANMPVSLHGALPHATFMASSSATFMLICMAIIFHDRLSLALAICLTAFPGALVISLFLTGSGLLSGLNRDDWSALNEVVRGITGSGAIGLLYVAILGIGHRLWRKDSQ